MSCQSWVAELNYLDRYQNSPSGSKTKKTASLRCALVLIFVLALSAWVERAEALSKMQVAYTWDTVRYRFDSAEQRDDLMARGLYVPGEAVIFDSDVDTDRNEVFITMPHLFTGSPITLATIENLEERRNPRLVPYPDMSWHAGNSGCDGLTSVYRIQVDGCRRLWVLDSGVDLQGGDFSRYRLTCPPQLLVFDLATRELIARHRFSIEDPTFAQPLLLAVVTEQMGDSCSNDVYAYVADAQDIGLYVFHLATGRSWRVTHDFFLEEVDARDFTVAGTKFSRMVGLLGLSVSPCVNDECERYLYAHAFTGYGEARVPTSILRNESLFIDNPNAARNFVGSIGKRHWQSAGQAMSKNGVLFFGHIGEYSLNCWNINTPYTPNYIHMVDYDYEHIRIQMGVKVVKYPNGDEELWSTSSNMQGLFAFDFTPNNTFPYNVVYGNLSELITGTVCDLTGV